MGATGSIIYSEALTCDLIGSPDLGTLNCSVTLANGAYFTMVMTYNGSERIGPQDYIELPLAADSCLSAVPPDGRERGAEPAHWARPRAIENEGFQPTKRTPR